MAFAVLIAGVVAEASAQSGKVTAVISAVAPTTMDMDRRRRRRIKKRKRKPKKVLRRPRPAGQSIASLAPNMSTAAGAGNDIVTAATKAVSAQERARAYSRLGFLRAQSGAPQPTAHHHMAVRPSLRPIKLTRRFRVDPGQPATRPVPLNAESSKAPIKIRHGVRVHSLNPGAVIPKVR